MIGQQAYDEACDWIVQLDSGSATAADRAIFVRWLNLRPENAHAYEEMSQLWARMGTLRADDQIPSRQRFHTGQTARTTSPSVSYRSVMTVSLLAILMMCVAVVLVDPASTGQLTQQFVTATGQKHRINATDGSVIELGPRSVLTLQYSQQQRLLLLDRGSATFTVASNPDRPFVVLSADSVITALGTEFEIVVDDISLTLNVNKGEVSIRATQAGPGHRELVLSAGQSVLYERAPSTLQLLNSSPLPAL